MDDKNVYQRLENEYKKHGKLVILFDFDDTVHDTYHRGEDKFSQVRELLRRWRPYATLIVHTVAPESKYPYIEEYLSSRSIPYDGINTDADVNLGTRKIYANATLDDRCGLATMYHVLKELVERIERGEVVRD
ncbi:MAG: hypothetical protein FWF84_05610 [Kiritimatiellaeota bacterium]|nr:hypothetical protein [Kiritimatiellota bacterium]